MGNVKKVSWTKQMARWLHDSSGQWREMNKQQFRGNKNVTWYSLTNWHSDGGCSTFVRTLVPFTKLHGVTTQQKFTVSIVRASSLTLSARVAKQLSVSHDWLTLILVVANTRRTNGLVWIALREVLTLTLWEGRSVLYVTSQWLSFIVNYYLSYSQIYVLLQSGNVQQQLSALTRRHKHNRTSGKFILNWNT